MHKEKQNNRPLILSIITLIICIALLIGATLAWFTDTETNTGNTIQAGTLDVELWVNTNENPNETVSDATGWTQITNESGTDAIFGDLFKNWAPGDEETIYLAVVNKGSLALDYTIDLVVTDDELADALQFKSVMSTGDIPIKYTYDYVTISSQIVDEVIPATGTTSNNLYADTIDFTMMSIKLDESTERTYQGEEFVMDLILVASQKDLVQNDSTAIVKAYTVADINGAAEDSTVILMQDITDASNGVNLSTNVNFDLNGYTLEVPSFTMSSNAYCTVDIANGTIKTTTMSVLIPNGTVNLDDMIGTIAEDGTVAFNASGSTLNLMGTTEFTNESGGEVPIEIMPDTRVVVDTSTGIAINLPDGTTGVEIENAETNDGSTTITGDTSDTVIDGSYPLGTEKNPYTISTVDDWMAMANDLDGYYVLADDVDFSDYSSNIKAIGSQTTPFTGTLDGQGFTLSNTTFKWSMFGCLEGATITNINFDNVNSGNTEGNGSFLCQGAEMSAEDLYITNITLTKCSSTVKSQSGGLIWTGSTGTHAAGNRYEGVLYMENISIKDTQFNGWANVCVFVSGYDGLQAVLANCTLDNVVIFGGESSPTTTDQVITRYAVSQDASDHYVTVDETTIQSAYDNFCSAYYTGTHGKITMSYDAYTALFNTQEYTFNEISW